MNPCTTESERFFAKVQKTDTCWLWTGSKATPLPYGQFATRDSSGVWRPTQAHRWSWAYVHGQIPNGLLVCHRCDNPPCVNPDHLFLGSYQANYDDAVAKGRIRHTSPKKRRRGSSHPQARLTEESVREMRALHDEQGYGMKRLAKRFGVGQTTIFRVLKNETWRHVT